MISRFLLGVGLIGLMLVASFGTYTYLAGRQSKVAVVAQKPTAASPRPNAFTLPGTLYLSQSGAIYSLSFGRFHQLTAQDGWTQPSLFPNNSNLLAVHRLYDHSDVFVLSRFGQPVAQWTSNNASGPDTGARHWSFYPRLSPDQGTLWMSYDEPKVGYDVPLSIWAVPAGNSIRQGKLWTNSIDYTGGDVEPIPLRTGGVMYTKYSRDDNANLTGQLWLAMRPARPANGLTLTTDGAEGQPLTSTDEDCAQPSISPDGGQVAMICTYQKQISYLVLASWNGSSLGPRRVVITDQLVAQPTWAPDGSGIAYLAPGAGASDFQLWFLPKARYNPPPPSPIPVPTPTPGGPYHGPASSPTPAPPVVVPLVKPIQMTTDAGFDATSPLAWAG
ncbi:MAG TPA: hypothetical protein DCF65_01290 [Chloroflexi bacterium]|jgi:hypothetical protein|nr:hypothetical protein [Chloroflexota bacterium]HAF18516.1 hypothetical protein [Chloroflexota bacterium]